LSPLWKPIAARMSEQVASSKAQVPPKQKPIAAMRPPSTPA
jgi:hypothetical protein